MPLNMLVLILLIIKQWVSSEEQLLQNICQMTDRCSTHKIFWPITYNCHLQCMVYLKPADNHAVNNM